MENNTSLIKELKHRAARIRCMSMKSTSEAGSGHPTSCLSVADILSVLFFKVMKYDPKNPASNANDRLVLSKGHAAPALYAAWAEAGYMKEEDVYTLRKMNSDIEGHPMPCLPFVDVATGSLGQGLSVGLGVSIFQSSVLKGDQRTYVILGDGELAEGSVWESFSLAAKLKTENLVAIIDVNRLGQSRETMHGHDLTSYAKKIEAFGWEAYVIDGHNISEIIQAFEKALKVHGKPACIIAKTFKGKGVSFMENSDGWHGKPLKKGDELQKALLEVEPDLMKSPPAPAISVPQQPKVKVTFDKKTPVVLPKILPPFEDGKSFATRQAVGKALVALGESDSRVWVIDGDTGNSTYADEFGVKFPERFVECYIAEQNMAGISAGLASRGAIPFAVTFGAFWSRAFDQIRMAALSGLNVKILGTHAGISIGEDGPSQMALEDLASFRTLQNSAVYYPSDAISAYYCILNLAAHNGPGYVRLSRMATPMLYKKDEVFPAGGLKVLNKCDSPKLTVITSGVIIHEALKAIKSAGSDSQVQLVDLYCLKPFPKEEIRKLISKSNGAVAVFEEHAPEGGIGEAVMSAAAGEIKKMTHVAVNKVPRSGTPNELLDSFGLSSEKIAATIKSLI
ncbi:MAG: transketolase [Candidatus Riflebacteria bacterium]|nr:transketolase [Candidatus Riflebacteria bacterium]